MKKTLALVAALAICFCLCSCEKEPEVSEAVDYSIDGVYVTDSAYGMEDFPSEITIKGNTLELYIEHFAVPVEEYSGSFTMEDNKILFSGEDKELEFLYDPDEKSVYNDTMETTWVLQDEAVTEEPAVAGEEPDPIPEAVRGEYVYSDEFMTATMTINAGDYSFRATAEGVEPLEISGDVVYAGNQLLLMEDGQSVPCPLDEANGTLEYSGYTFKKQ